ncbi:hypothetical protein DOTSEDRAFT_82475 [Dothistroma septosporum NZE10]|uniref:Uncharacterized protein n=1 Tax=Dothistroma septosporum (strain NZE10 / CBS 128990) TaxID=675120 RepID=N1PFV1_DOTSN|nr:hypothetical protein DOTSEDRAFT_82475 [Dothistroma septosporum NZE10]
MFLLKLFWICSWRKAASGSEKCSRGTNTGDGQEEDVFGFAGHSDDAVGNGYDTVAKTDLRGKCGDVEARGALRSTQQVPNTNHIVLYPTILSIVPTTMVLEDATSTPDFQDAFTSSDSLPSSSPDLYSGDRYPQVLETRDPSYIAISPGIYVNTQTLPTPFLTSKHHPALNKSILETCQQASALLNRPVRQEEADALAFHFARALRIGSYGAPLGVAVGTALFYRGYANGTNRFPGWTPDKQKFTFTQFGPLKGTRAKIMWQSLRFSAYGIVGTVLGGMFVGSYALTAGSAGRLMDPRLKELGEKIRERAKSGKGGELLPGQMAGGREVDQSAGMRTRDGETFDMARQRRGVQRSEREGKASRGEMVDDASPTGGMFMSDYQDSGTPNDSGIMSDGHVKQRDSQVRFDEAKKETQQSRDDGSRATPKSSGSAWERLRQQANSGAPGQSSMKNSRDASSTGDSFMFSQAEEDRQLPRVEQQKQFDQRVEREREGKDFESQTGGWRK